MKVYIASGWFNKKQEQARLEILESCKFAKIKFYSPKDDFLYIPGKTDPEEVFNENLIQIKRSDFIIASTVDKDMGTLFECGCSYILNKPIIYYWPDGEGPFNLMLAQTAWQVCVSFEQLKFNLQNVKKDGYVKKIQYEGEIE